MAELKKLISTRRGYRAHLTILLQSVTEILNNAQPLSEDNIATMRDLHEQLQRKQELISGLDAKILKVTSEEEIEAEILHTEEISSSISTAKAKITHRLSSTTSAEVTARRPEARTSAQEHVTRLPKLDLPQFAGNPLHWQSFWDCFEATVHVNSSLTGVQKLSYLRAQLCGDAARVIAGFQLTNNSYDHSITLLKQRFGQTYKQVEARMQALIDSPSPNNTLPSLREFYDTTEGHIRSLTTLGKPKDSYGSLLVPILLGKLPSKTKQNIIRAHGRNEWTITELQTAILNELHILEMGLTAEPQTPQVPPTAAFYTGTKKGKRCPFCTGSHIPSLCESVKDPKQRCDIVRQNKLCYNCLGHHKVSSCNSKHRCHNCQRKHHTSLCTSGQQNANPSEQPTNDAQQTPTLPGQSSTTTNKNSTETTSLSMTLPSSKNSVCLLKTAVATITNGEKRTRANLLFDEGSQRSFITQDLANTLALQPCRKEDITISSFGTQCQLNRQMAVAVVNLLTLSGQTVPLTVLVVPHIATPIQNTVSSNVTRLPHLKNLTLAHSLTTDREFEISLLVGADHYWDIIGDKIVRGDGPTAVESKLGYLLSGPAPPATGQFLTSTSSVMMLLTTPNEFNLEHFWDLESIGVTYTSDGPVDKALDHYLASCVTRDQDGAYVARFPWKPDYPDLPTNLTVAKQRTRQLVKRLFKTPDLLKTYHQILSEQETRGFIERVDDQPTIHSGIHYIPHHAVEKNSATTPIRIVFDCSCRQSSNHPCLNDCLIIGSPCNNDLCAMLIRFRTHCFGISTDIEKAFLHIRLHPDDRNYTRFFWLSNLADPSSQFCVYRFKVVPFGATSSPFMLNAVLQYHLRQYNIAVSRDMLSNLYVDNIISGCDTEQAAVNYYRTARAIMCDAQLNLRSWSSNSAELTAAAVKDNTAERALSVNVLGLRWTPTSDKLHLATNPHVLPYDHLVTKREILQGISKIFDPLGFIAPVVIQAKLLMQKLWQLKVTWDEPLNDDIQTQWRDIATNLKEATQFTVSRCYFNTCMTDPVIHCFADASQLAYGAIVFLTQGNQVSFVTAKTRVAPLKTLTIPRLELMAAMIAARLTKFVLTTIHAHNPPIFLWSDSQIVLHWIKSQKPLPAFVRHRITEINSLLPNATWNYCPTAENPADLLSRGTTYESLMSSSLWQHGPQWLTTPHQWPSSPPTLPTLALAAAVATEFVPIEQPPPDLGLHCIISINRHGSLNKLLSVTACVFRFVNNLRVPPQKQCGPITAEELHKMNLKWVKDTQLTVYRKEINNLQLIMKQPKTPRVPLVRQLRLFLDTDGLLRCGGRIHNAPVSEITKFPYLLPSRHSLSRLVILDIHVRLCHSGTATTVTALRQSYWIPAARQYVKSILHHCVTCRKITGKPYPAPDPPPLPRLRTQDVHPFTFTGVDFTGALYVRQGKEEVKVYLCLFTCATTRAVHLEIVQDLTADMFLLAFRKFAGRRSLPTIMISDNGSTYLSAADELHTLMELPEVKDELGKRGVSWQFIPKRAPWYGGFWERLIGLTKTAIKKVLGRRHVSLPTLEMIIVEIEAILNDRPLTFVSSEFGDPEPLTPAHLLHGRRITCLPHETVEFDELTDPNYREASQVRKRAKVQAAVLRDFQRRWRNEYLTSLRDYHKTSGNNNQYVKKGDVVVVHDDVPRTTWRMAVVEDLIVGGDGLVRAATIRTTSGMTTRPITKLYPVELNETDEVNLGVEKSYSVPGGLADSRSKNSRPQRAAARKATDQIKEWVSVLSAPPEDVAADKL